jgi:hypothetical protein
VSRTRTRTRNSLPGQDRATFTDERVKTRKRVKDPDRVGQTRRRETLAQGRTRVAEPWHSDSAVSSGEKACPTESRRKLEGSNLSPAKLGRTQDQYTGSKERVHWVPRVPGSDVKFTVKIHFFTSQSRFTMPGSESGGCQMDASILSKTNVEFDGHSIEHEWA